MPTYLNTAACGLLSPQSLASTYDFYTAMQSASSTRAEAWKTTEWQSVRETTARFVNAPVQNVVFVPNFSFGINSIVQSLRGDEKVLLYKNDYPSLLDPFRINKFDISWIDSTDGFTVSADELKSTLLSNKIDILAISHVQWLSGFKFDIEDLGAFCRQHGIMYMVDATQSLGALVTDVSKLNADVLIASNYKWMNGGFGTGIMYIADSFLQRYPPVISGFNSYIIKDGVAAIESPIRCYEPGHLNIHGLLVLEAAMKEKLEQGVDKIEEHNRHLTQRLLNGIADLPVKLLGEAGTQTRSSIILIKDEGGLGAYIAEKDIIVSQRGGFLRVSMHFYNTEADVDHFTDILRTFFKKGQ